MTLKNSKKISFNKKSTSSYSISTSKKNLERQKLTRKAKKVRYSKVK